MPDSLIDTGAPQFGHCVIWAVSPTRVRAAWLRMKVQNSVNGWIVFIPTDHFARVIDLIVFGDGVEADGNTVKVRVARDVRDGAAIDGQVFERRRGQQCDQNAAPLSRGAAYNRSAHPSLQGELSPWL